MKASRTVRAASSFLRLKDQLIASAPCPRETLRDCGCVSETRHSRARGRATRHLTLSSSVMLMEAERVLTDIVGDMAEVVGVSSAHTAHSQEGAT